MLAECSQDCPNPTPNRSSSVNGLRLNNVRASSTLYSACTIGPLWERGGELRRFSESLSSYQKESSLLRHFVFLLELTDIGFAIAAEPFFVRLGFAGLSRLVVLHLLVDVVVGHFTVVS